MQIIHMLNALRVGAGRIRATGQSIALVPTMGALHKGHMALVDRAKREADAVVVSIFVNPTQFGPNEDLASYPRRFDEDAAMLEAAGVAVLWAPSVEDMYPEGFATTISVARLGDRLCGAARPGHFDGVATVVAKLFGQVMPDVAVFGEKDWQQLAIIRRMAHDLDLDLRIVGEPTVREADGLALSSRNAYLDDAERAAAVALPNALARAKAEIEGGKPVASALETVRQSLDQAGFASIDYVELVDALSLEPLVTVDREARLLAAARLGKARLIDNIRLAAKN